MERVGVFVSYARSDGEDATRRLAEDLRAEGIEVWMDRLDMDGGRDWWQQILQGIEASSFLVLVMTPAAAASEVTAREIRYAREQGKCVFPIKGSPDLDFGALPRWMRAMHFYTLPNEWENLLGDLRGPCEVDRLPFMAPPLPTGYVERRRELDALKTLVLDERGDVVPTTTSLQGFGGYGKTTLAAALCHDGDVAAAFDHGVLWVTLGREEDTVRRELDRLHQALTGAPSPAVDVRDAARDVAYRLRDKRALVVIDDVWRRSDLRWFLQEGDKTCAELVTTRQFDVAQEAATDQGAQIRVDEMTAGEATELLTARLDPAPTDMSPFQALVHRLGEWPLLVELARGALHDRLDRGAALDRALEYVNEALERHGLLAFDQRDSDQRNDAASASAAMSLGLLEPADADRWAELAVFPEDTPIPLRTLSQLWQLDDFATEELATRLGDLSLLRLDLDTDSVHIHDVLLAVAQQRASDIEGLHQRLVAAWGDPHSIPADDDYAWQWIGHHLNAAEQAATLRALLLDPAWITSKVRFAGTNSAISDYQRLPDDEDLAVLGAAIRISSHVLNRDPDQLPSQLHGRLSPDMGLGVAQLLAATDEVITYPWLRPQTQSLVPPGGPLLRTFEGHTEGVAAVAVTPDGTRIVSGSGDTTVKVWDRETGDLLRTLESHIGGVLAVAVTPDGGRIVTAGRDTAGVWDPEHGMSASGDATVKVWDRETGDLLRTLEGHTSEVAAVAVTPDGTRIVSGSGDNTVRVWDLESGDLLRTLEGHTEGVAAVAVTPDGTRIVSGSYNAASASPDATVRVWDLETGDLLRTLEGHTRGVRGVAVTPDGTRVISASGDWTVKVWDLESGDLLRTLAGSGSEVAVFPDGSRVVTVSGITVEVADLETGEVLRTLEGHTNFVSGVAVTPDSTRIVSASWDGTVKLWDPEASYEHGTLEAHAFAVHGIAVTPDGSRIVTASGDFTVKVWSLESGDLLRTLEGHDHQVSAVAVTPDGSRIVTAAGDAYVWDLKTGGIIGALEGRDSVVIAVAVSPDGTRIVTGSDDNTVKVWNLATGPRWTRRLRARTTSRDDLLRTLEGHTDRLTAVAVTPDGTRIVSGSEDTTVKVWDLETGEHLRTLEGHSSGVAAVAVTPDGTRVITGSDDNTVKVWDLETGDPLRTLEGHTDPLTAVAVTPDGTRIVTASADNTMKVWESETGTIVASVTADGYLSVCATADGRRFCTAGASGRVHILDLIEPASGDR